MEEYKITERDINVSEKIARIEQGITSLKEKIDQGLHDFNTKLDHMMESKENTHNAMWSKIDLNADKIERANHKIHWIIGIGVGIQVGWAMFINFLKG